jgi:uncharacterized membrane protein YdjX (TVP38/TMEM64 family)
MRLVWRPALLLVGLAVAGLAIQLLPEGGASGLLARMAAIRGLTGGAVFLAGGALLCAVGVPRQIVGYAAGYAFGVWIGVALAMGAQLAACAGNFVWARMVGRDWARGAMEKRWKGRLARVDGFLAANPFTATVTLRLLPVGNNLALNLLAGASGIAAFPFLAGSAIGYVPQTLIFALVGSGARVDRATQLGVGVVLFAASAATGALLVRRYRALAPV